MPTITKRKNDAQRRIGRVTRAQAAAFLGVSDDSIGDYVDRGWIRPWTPNGIRGRGIAMFFDRLELRAFLIGGAAGAKAYRESKTGDR